MAKAVYLQVADAITSELNRTSFSLEFQARRSYVTWDHLLEDDELRVDVVGVGQRTDLETHGSWQVRAWVDVGVRCRFPQDLQDPETGEIESEEIDRVASLLVELGEHFMPKQPDQDGRLEDMPDAAWASDEPESGSALKQPYIHQWLREQRQFGGFVRLTYLVPK